MIYDIFYIYYLNFMKNLSSSQAIQEKLSSMKMLLNKRKSFMKISLYSLIIDIVFFLTFNIIEYINIINFSLKTEVLIIKILIQLLLSMWVCYLIIRSYRKALLISVIIYFLIGIGYTLFSIYENMLINEIDFDSNNEKGKNMFTDTYYSDGCLIVVIIFIILSFLTKSIASISSILYFFFNENYENEFKVINIDTYIAFNFGGNLNKNDISASIDVIDMSNTNKQIDNYCGKKNSNDSQMNRSHHSENLFENDEYGLCDDINEKSEIFIKK